ncbi:hypothetical protein Acor_23760 [Acrocarpospora corrugata]|uniref:Ig-like domain-containing protein n=1 Tax=Acrocarpospora corrugata TaxID=35763 RepID=A0A5M3VZ00_9ACTN|nr:hypothetical protein [Acrocarpospora corrugata]GES00313.1 hypothetical protein Acor_23760 [Acrocarpospora corrugata]
MRSSPRLWIARLAAMTAVALGASLAVALPAHAAIGTRPVEFVWTTLGPFQEGSATVGCNAGEKVISGGYLSQNLSPQVKFTASYPSSDTQWLVTAVNRSNITQEVHIRAICATGVTGYARAFSPFGTVGSGSFGDATAQCASGKIALGGGFIFARDERLVVNASRLSATNTWQTRVYNGATATANPQAAVTCTSLTGQFTLLSGVQANTGQSGFFFSKCATGITTGGGFRFIGGDSSSTVVTATIPTSPGWKLNFNNQTGTNRVIEQSLVCFP